MLLLQLYLYIKAINEPIDKEFKMIDHVSYFLCTLYVMTHDVDVSQNLVSEYCGYCMNLFGPEQD